MENHLVILGCSANKVAEPDLLPALSRYDGPYYRVINKFLRSSIWPTNLSVGVLSAKYGLIGGLTQIEYYNQKMNRDRASELKSSTTGTVLKWSEKHKNISLLLGKDYLEALNFDILKKNKIAHKIVNGPIGLKLNHLHGLLRGFQSNPRNSAPELPQKTPLYFLPDWDDVLDEDFDFTNDRFSHAKKSERNEKHCVRIMQPEKICDGILVSLAQNLGNKGFLRKFNSTDFGSLAPKSIREHYGLSRNQFAFGDCGAFSYVHKASPSISTEQAVSLYQLHGFDLGASVDHIPLPDIVIDGEKKLLSISEREKRVEITKHNALRFIELHQNKKCTFTPVGVIQGISEESYAKQLPEYIEAGYTHVAIGGLVPRSDAEIIKIIQELNKVRQNLRPGIQEKLWIHLFGIFRPNIQEFIQSSKIASFDSATYFRKAWLRSNQNYLGNNGEWYSAIRVPMTSDPRTIKRLKTSGLSISKLEVLEQKALKSLHSFAHKNENLNSVLNAIYEYDSLLTRNSEDSKKMIRSYAKTLTSRIWEKCGCPACKQTGIDVIIFRGCNRNKRRGAHNTLQLYKNIGK
ncbi:MAG: hypothetical protein H7A23_15150 [Leptospiraceae bacterium]|nr:hypothetical protein [Leptospiraceae bacterium]